MGGRMSKGGKLAFVYCLSWHTAWMAFRNMVVVDFWRIFDFFEGRSCLVDENFRTVLYDIYACGSVEHFAISQCVMLVRQ